MKISYEREEDILMIETGNEGIIDHAKRTGPFITMYFDDQHHPHFHARYAEYRAGFTIDPPALYTGAMPRRQQNMILGWAEIHQQELMANWQRARTGQPMQKIGGLA